MQDNNTYIAIIITIACHEIIEVLLHLQTIKSFPLLALSPPAACLHEILIACKYGLLGEGKFYVSNNFSVTNTFDRSLETVSTLVYLCHYSFRCILENIGQT